jgi:peptidoglycan-associated lipoprotein
LSVIRAGMNEQERSYGFSELQPEGIPRQANPTITIIQEGIMKIRVTRMFVRRSLVYAVAAAGLLAFGCATEQAATKSAQQLEAERKAREEAERQKWADVSKKADALFEQKTMDSVAEAIRLWESMPEALRPADKIAQARNWLANAKAEAEAKAKAEAEARTLAEAEAEARRMDNVLFDYDKYSIRDDQKAGLAKTVEKLKARPEFKATIEGHCDERGTIEYNMALGQKRAESAKKFVVKAGIDTKRLSTVSFGKERPLDTGHDESAWAKNRRAEVKVTAP